MASHCVTFSNPGQDAQYRARTGIHGRVMTISSCVNQIRAFGISPLTVAHVSYRNNNFPLLRGDCTQNRNSACLVRYHCFKNDI